MAYDIEKEIQNRVAKAALGYDHLGILEKTQEQIDCLTNIVATLVQILVKTKTLSEKDLYDL